ncbi:hypothetical protein TNCV_1608791 [Trichonephila clavipes]|nr:hypothetical protein TNCV_1608791 [Trichonephila clavipes]
MQAPGSSINPTPLAHADNQGDVHPKGTTSQIYGTKVKVVWGRGENSFTVKPGWALSRSRSTAGPLRHLEVTS